MPETGHYLGTEVEEKWWKRYTKDKLFMRGLGTYWHDSEGFYFLRYLTRRPIFIPFSAMRSLKTGTWHSGKWALGRPVLKIIWQKENTTLSSGFIVAKDEDGTNSFKDILEKRIVT